MITGVHAIVFSAKADAVRTFFRDTLGFTSVDAGGGWLVFRLPPAELAAHPVEEGGHHELYLMCDDIHATVEDLKRKGVEFTNDITDVRWGLLAAFNMPDGTEMALYQPRHPTAIEAATPASA